MKRPRHIRKRGRKRHGFWSLWKSTATAIKPGLFFLTFSKKLLPTKTKGSTKLKEIKKCYTLKLGFLGKSSNFLGKKLKDFGFKTQRYSSSPLHLTTKKCLKDKPALKLNSVIQW